MCRLSTSIFTWKISAVFRWLNVLSWWWRYAICQSPKLLSSQIWDYTICPTDTSHKAAPNSVRPPWYCCETELLKESRCSPSFLLCFIYNKLLTATKSYYNCSKLMISSSNETWKISLTLKQIIGCERRCSWYLVCALQLLHPDGFPVKCCRTVITLMRKGSCQQSLCKVLQV